MTTDITIDGVHFIMEITLPKLNEDADAGYMTLTEACNAEEECVLVPERVGWRCTTHNLWQSVTMLDSDDHCQEYGICDSHQTYDFQGVA